MASINPENIGHKQDYKTVVRKQKIIPIILGVLLLAAITAITTILVIYLKGNSEVSKNNICKNGGSREEDQNKCDSFHGYVGDNSTDSKICGNDTCKNGGSCEEDQISLLGYKCNCVHGYVGNNCTLSVLPRDCNDLRVNGQNESGVYKISLSSDVISPLNVYCEMETFGGGWTVIQKRARENEYLSFDRTWGEYKNGFGTPQENIWIGNDVIHQLTKDKDSSLYVSITFSNDTTAYELYDRFSVSDETDKYRLYLAGPATGTLGDSMLNTGDPNKDLSGMFFSTPERDNDPVRYINCAALRRGGWWFNTCNRAFLNGPWDGGVAWMAPWYPLLTGSNVKATMMMVKRV